MEVHHHPTIEKKHFREYFLEFLMIFLAVSMGFIAENIREHIADNGREKEYILSMIEDAATDTINIQKNILANQVRAERLDSLATLCTSYNPGANADAKMYRLLKAGTVHPDCVSATERTMQQLKNAGGMRLIRKKAAVDSIVLYDDAAKKLIDQQAYYELYQNGMVNEAIQLFNLQRLGFWASGRHSKPFVDGDSSVHILSHDPTLLMSFSNRLSIYQGVVSFYNVRLRQMNEHAASLIKTLRKEYDIEE